MSTQIHAVVVGAGPSGLFAAAEFLKRFGNGRVDVFDKDPTPFGLLRYGVAPDHLKIKSLARTFANIVVDDRVRFLGNVALGPDITIADLKRHYHLVILAVGAPGSRRLDIPGEDLPGSLHAGALVAWYNAHPDAPSEAPFPLPARHALVIGAGNVALDVSRILLKGSRGLAHTDIPTPTLESLGPAPVQDVTVLVRRGVAQAKFSVAELLEFDHLEGVQPVVDAEDLSLSANDREAIEKSPQLGQVVDTFRRWSQRPAVPGLRRVNFAFWSSPAQITGVDRVSGLVVTRNDRDAQYLLAADAVVSAVGFVGRPLPGVPFDVASGTVDHLDGRVVGHPNVYVTGWCKRGPSGVIGSNKACAKRTVDAVVADFQDDRVRSCRGYAGLEPLLKTLRVVSSEEWLRIDAAEVANGQREGRERAKLRGRAALLAPAEH